MDAAWLGAQIGSPTLRILDCSDISAYRDGHIPGAGHLWWQDTIEVNNPIYGMLAGFERRRDVFRKAGVDSDSTVVAYDDNGGTSAARVVWALHTLGFTAARLLDGGRQAWVAAGHNLTSTSSVHAGGSLEGAHVEEVLAHAHDIEAWLERDDVVILDTRTDDERAETLHGSLRSGRIPGSAWLPRDRWHAESESPFLCPADELRRRLASAGVALDAPEVVVYGLHSALAALPYLALRALGVPRVRVYDGSWAEWGASERPVEPL